MNTSRKTWVKTAASAIILLIVIATTGQTDIANGTFEIDGQPSLEGWEWISAASYQDAPPGGGSWCVRLQGGCVHGVCWQADRDIRNGEVWRVSCWLRRDVDTPHGWGTLGWYVITGDGWQNGNVAMCDSTDWTLLSVTDTFFLSEGDTVGVFIDGGGGFAGDGTVYFDLVETETITSVAREISDGLLTNPRIRLYGSQPNPVWEKTAIQYELPQSGTVYMAIYDMLGREAVTLVDEEQPAGFYTVVWDGTDSAGRKVPSGVYFYTLSAGDFASTKKMILLR